tara:strand:+ start:153 stop:1046 length:894 start_codon:yes stop_codon:yes gene_type:complete
MKLKFLNTKLKINIIKDGDFLNLGHAVVLNEEKLLTFCDDEKYIDTIKTNKNISTLICHPKMVDEFKNHNFGIISSNTPRETFFKIHNLLIPNITKQNTLIAKDAQISKKSTISEFNVKIGKNCIIEENVIIRSNVYIGDNSIIRSGSIIGGEGFQFLRTTNDEILTINHYGKVLIGEGVEIKEHCSIHKAVFLWDVTMVGDFTKVDAHCHIGHGNRIGKKILLGSHTNISGNSTINDNSYIGPGVNIPNRITIEESSKISVGSTITKDVKANTTVSGNFAILHKKYLKHIKNINNG